jgi:hypothetical protein
MTGVYPLGIQERQVFATEFPREEALRDRAQAMPVGHGHLVTDVLCELCDSVAKGI